MSNYQFFSAVGTAKFLRARRAIAASFLFLLGTQNLPLSAAATAESAIAQYSSETAKFLLARRAIAGNFLSVLTTENPSVMADSREESAIAPSTSEIATSIVSLRLLGQWQVRDPVSGDTLTFIFTNQGQLFILEYISTQPRIAYNVPYRIHATRSFTNLDLVDDGNPLPFAILEFSPEGQLRVEFAIAGERPTTFSPDAMLLSKISSTTPTGAELQVIENSSRQTEARHFVGAVNRQQQRFLQESGQFANDIAQLGIPIDPQTDNYRYHILRDRDRGVMIVAHPLHAGLHSYTGVVFVVDVNGKKTMVTGICESDQPSSSPPAMPRISTDPGRQIQCPSGSHILGGNWGVGIG